MNPSLLFLSSRHIHAACQDLVWGVKFYLHEYFFYLSNCLGSFRFKSITNDHVIYYWDKIVAKKFTGTEIRI